MHKRATILFVSQKNTTFAVAKSPKGIRKVSYIVRIVIGIVIALYLGLLLFTALPSCQRWLAVKVSDVLSEEWNTKVSIGNARIGLFNRIVLDDALVCDQTGDTLFSAVRLSATLNPWELINGRVRIGNVQLFGYHIQLRRHTQEQPYNFQFLVDYFASEDSTETAFDLSINSIIIRRGTLTHELDYEPKTNTFTPAHIYLQDLDIRASIGTFTNDSISIDISHLSLTDSISRLRVKNLAGRLISTENELQLNDLCLTLPHSELSLPSFVLKGKPEEWKTCQSSAIFKGQITPADFGVFLPLLDNFKQTFDMETIFEKEGADIRIPHFSANTNNFGVSAEAYGILNLEDSTQAHPFDEININNIRLRAQEGFILPLLDALAAITTKEGPPLLSPDLAATISRVGDIELSGNINGTQSPYQMNAKVDLRTSIGALQATASTQDDTRYKFKVQTSDVRLATLLGSANNESFDHVNLNADLEGDVKRKTLKGTLAANRLEAFGTTIDRVQADVALTSREIKATAKLEDDEYGASITCEFQSDQDIQPNVNILDDLQGFVNLNKLYIHRPDRDYELKQLRLALNNDASGHHMLLQGDFIDAHVDGLFQYNQLLPSLKHFLHEAMPSVVDAPEVQIAKSDNQMNFSIHIWNATPLLELAELDLKLPEPGYIEGHLNDDDASLSVMADFPYAIYGSENLRAVSMLYRQEKDSVITFVTLQRMMEDGPVDISVSAEGRNDHLKAFLSWDDHNSPAQRGELIANTQFYKDEQQLLGTKIALEPGQILVSDTLWNIHASQINYHDKVLDINGFQCSQENRHLRVSGRISDQPIDTLYCDLRGINLQYVFGLLDFHDVELAGLATGHVKVHDILTDIAVDAQLEVEEFTVNDGLLGKLFVTGGFGRKDEQAIDLDGIIQEPHQGLLSHVTALIKPGHEPGRGIDLSVQANHLNVYFINSFTEGIFSEPEGMASGYARLYGPFRALDLEGNLVLDTLALAIDVLDTRYHSAGGDSITLFPGGIRFHDIHILDRYHGTDANAHSAVLKGELRYEHFDNIRYDFNIEAQEFLGYDFQDFGDQSFYGSVYANGNVHLSGQPGAMNIDIQCTPTSGSSFTYNATSPETLTDNGFITFVSANQSILPQLTANATNSSGELEDDEPMDIRMNFDINVTPEAQMRLLMDARTEDYITLNGDGHIRANYYNKGRFQMYGTYHVDHGTYKLTLQDVIRKDFRFQRGGTIVFGGNPMKGDLNLQAIYTVPSVSLNDLAAGSNFSNTNVRVNCLMNITGRPEQPQISFDFDIPNVNEDEKQMVRSLISTDEERNMQVIYLLGIGRFYTQDLAAGQSQTNAAMQGLLSSTLSGQLNELLANAIGNSNWNFGTSLSTGNMGWNEVDVEGMLSGRLLNNRLLINGTFGYRDTPMANTNFIGDFDVQWLLMPSGNLSLKAYSETNDRYFTKTALTTQGVGLQVKKDFNTLRELFQPRNK